MSETNSHVGKVISRERLVQHKAYSIARGAIIEALDHLGKDIKNAQQYCDTISKYNAMLQDVLIDDSTRFIQEDLPK